MGIYSVSVSFVIRFDIKVNLSKAKQIMNSKWKQYLHPHSWISSRSAQNNG